MKIVVIPGDGIGPEIVSATVSVLEAASRKFALGLAFESRDVGLVTLKSVGTTFPPEVLEACRGAGGIVLGPVSHQDYPPKAQGGVNPSGALRIQLDLFANVRPSRSREGMQHWGRTPMDLVIVRENTEGFYADRNMHSGPGEFMPTPDTALAIRKVTAKASERIAKSAFALAEKRRRKVTAVHKQNVMRVSDGLFLAEVRKVAAANPGIAYEEQLVDSMAALLVRDAARYDVIVTTNMFGDILSDEAAELSGSLGLAGSINAGVDHCMAQASHGSAPDIAGQDKANPTSLILSAAMLLEWLGIRHKREAFLDAHQAIETAIDTLLRDPARRTADLGGRLGTKAFTAALCEELAR
ncbi:Homoisocitrate dehydrogenase [Usitatibacter rugosus]|uniref:Homoisocitrate dehydrogenase n=1 Tax=Usitatibacter rugosus TaxID=2732067 RepID=A0A6M4H0Q6_9PROT|nr:isocitrate/isopropylmalate dehydrogenase family protein [Usitatibacter rugosus]QJR12234.1 Homoisocitrate dehydrogenase [Usitatibacter rugosus]